MPIAMQAFVICRFFIQSLDGWNINGGQFDIFQVPILIISTNTFKENGSNKINTKGLSLDMIDINIKLIPNFFGRQKLHKKGSRNVFLFT